MAESAAVAGQLPMAAEMPPPTEKQVSKSIFDGCSVDGINILKNGAVEYLEKVVAEESEEDLYEFFLPKKIWSDLDKTIISVKDLTSGKAQTQAIKTREKLFQWQLLIQPSIF